MKKSLQSSEKILDLPGITGNKLFTSPDVELVHLSLNPGKQMVPHTMPMKVIFYILEGKIDVVLDNETFSLSANEFIEAPVGAERYTANTSDKPARILVIKHPIA